MRSFHGCVFRCKDTRTFLSLFPFYPYSPQPGVLCQQFMLFLLPNSLLFRNANPIIILKALSLPADQTREASTSPGVSDVEMEPNAVEVSINVSPEPAQHDGFAPNESEESPEHLGHKDAANSEESELPFRDHVCSHEGAHLNVAEACFLPT